MEIVKSLIITGFGINCEEEMAAAYRLAGAEATIVHLNEILLKDYSIHDYDVLNFPGGFSFGDDLSSGKVMANKIKFKKLTNGNTLIDELKLFLEVGKYIVGICNGFQMLVKMGLLPNINGQFEQEVSLIQNDSAQYEDRWVHCKVTADNPSPLTKNIQQFAVPVRHGEGKLIVLEPSIKDAILNQKLNCLSYCTADGSITDEYPYNPNGADLNCAGLCDPSGQVFGMMPHPEAYLSLYNHPDWARKKRINPALSEDGEGLQLFKNIVQHIQSQQTTANTQK